MSKISIIGGITADIEGHPYDKLIHGDSNPGTIAMSYGGVGRNIAENLARMGVPVNFVSVAGDDFAGRGAVRELKELGVNVDNIELLEDENTAVYMSILNLVGDMELAMINMDIFERMSNDFIDRALGCVRNSEMVGLDTNLAEDALEYVTGKLTDTPLFLDPVSSAKAIRAKKVIGRFHTIKPNRAEAEAISGLPILSEKELEEAGEWFLKEGVKRVFITLGGGGVYYRDEKNSGTLRVGSIDLKSATGAGDAFSAALLYAHINGMSLEEAAKYGMAASSIAISSPRAVNPLMSEKVLLQARKSQEGKA